MGLLPFRKNKKKKEPASAAPAATVQNDAAAHSTISAPIVGAAPPVVVTAEKKKWSPMRKKVTTATTADSSLFKTANKPTTTNILGSLSVMAQDDVEVMTFESQRALMDQREAIRKKLFQDSSNTAQEDDKRNSKDSDDGDGLHRSFDDSTATEISKEILLDGKVKDTAVLASDRFSLPLESVTSSSWDCGSLSKIIEEPVHYGSHTPPRTTAITRAATGPISVDISYTESELGSLLSTPSLTPSPPNRYDNKSSLESPSFRQRGSENSEYFGPITTSQKSKQPGANFAPWRSKSAAAVVSPASSRSSVPMDEREIDTEVERYRNKGKSPLKGMPDDERLEYQKDEMTLLLSPVKEMGPGLITASPPAINNDDSFLMPESVTDVVKSTEVDPALFQVDEKTTGDTSISETATDSTRSSLRFPDVARSVMEAALQCGSDALNNTLGGGGLATTGRGKNDKESSPLETYQHQNKRPVYLDEASTLRFLRRITNNGFVLLYLQPVEESSTDTDPTDNWKGRTVTMLINKGQVDNRGDSSETSFQPPRLEWITVTGGQAVDATTTSMNLIDIHSILTNDEEVEDEDDMCFFTITSENGDVHIFEAATLEERDRIVNGLKTVIARWSFQLIAGDITATSELYSSHSYEDASPDEDLPTLPNPSQTMNRVAHMLLDAVTGS